jgi:uncharacterized protein (DUF2062 family)
VQSIACWTFSCSNHSPFGKRILISLSVNCLVSFFKGCGIHGGAGCTRDSCDSPDRCQPCSKLSCVFVCSKLLDLASSSIFTFTAPDLEAAFQAHQAQAISLLSWLCALMNLAGYCILMSKVASASLSMQRVVLEHLPWALVLQLGPTLACLLLMTFSHNFYGSNRLAVNLLANSCVVVGISSVRHVVLWMRQVSGTNPSSSLLQAFQSFSNENLILTTSWLAVAGFPSGLVGDFVFMAGMLAMYFSSNKSICASPTWHSNAVTLWPGPLAAAQGISSWMLSTAAPFYHKPGTQAITSCEEALGVWEVMGSWIGCLVGCLAEISRRQAFLKTPAAQDCLRRHSASPAMRWPFGCFSLAAKFAQLLSLLTLAHCVMWAVALDLLQ